MFSSPSVRVRRRPMDIVDDTQSKKQRTAVPPAWLGPLAQPSAHLSVEPTDVDTHGNAQQGEEEEDEDEDEDLLPVGGQLRALLRGERHSVLQAGSVPEEVRGFVSQALHNGEALECGAHAGFAHVATNSWCLVWAYGVSDDGIVYRLQMPPAGHAERPVVMLVEGRATGDTGVLAVGGSGQVRFWDRVVFGLGGPAGFQTTELGVLDGEDWCERLVLVRPGLAVAGTRCGLLFQVAFDPLSVLPLTRGAGAGSLLTHVSQLLGASQPIGVARGDRLVGLAAGARTDMRQSREVLLLTRTRLMKWVVSLAHPDRLLVSVDAAQLVRRYAAAARVSDDAMADVRLVDVAAGIDGDVLVLVELSTPTGPTAALAVLRSTNVSDLPAVAALWPLKHAIAKSSKLVAPGGGPAAFIVQHDSVIVTVLPASKGASAVAFETHVPFRDSDSVLGFGKGPDSSCVEIVCVGKTDSIGAGVLRVTVDAARAQAQALSQPRPESRTSVDMDISASSSSRPVDSSSLTAQTRRLTAQLEQAVFYETTSTPLCFKITSQASGIDTALQAAALHVSRAILDGSSRLIADRLDMSMHLRERFRRAHAVIRVLSSNGLVHKLEPSAILQIQSTAEQLSAAVALWARQNTVWTGVAASSVPAAAQFLPNAAAAFLESRGLRPRDALKDVLRYHVRSLGDLLVFLQSRLPALRRALEVSERGTHAGRLAAYEAMRIITDTLQAALRYRFQHAELYALPEGFAPNYWTAQPKLAEMLADCLEGGYRLCRDLSSVHSPAVYERISATVLPGDECADGSQLAVFDDAVLISFSSDADAPAVPIAGDPYDSAAILLVDCINLMGPLANLCFRAFVDLLASNQQQDPGALSARYDSVRSRYLLCLVPLARAPVAFRLAEEYRDLHTLVALVYATDADNALEHIRNYIEQFGRDFARTLFTYYERRQAWASLLASSGQGGAEFDEWLKEYIDEREQEVPHNSLTPAMAQIGWIHDVKVDDFNAAAAKLAKAARGSEDVAQARNMLSLSKLAFVICEGADAAEGQINPLTSEAHIRLEDALELCEIQDNVKQFMWELVSKSDCQLSAGQDVEKAALDAAMLTTSPELRHSRPALYTAYCNHLSRLLGGHTLAPEAVLDTLTFPDSLSADVPDPLLSDRYALAVDILGRASFGLSDDPLQRDALMAMIWRRIFLLDDWNKIHARVSSENMPDSLLRSELLSTQLYHVLRSCLVNHELTYSSAYFAEPKLVTVAEDHVEYFTKRFGDEVASDLKADNEALQGVLASGLSEYYDEILKIVVDVSNNCLLSEKLGGDDDDDVDMESD
ncbi:hypothetical protein GGI07_003406 [Coemansia sp. Benny D115]|nr:hypothetical protein GGI07_003406 [Coemansia sp. Benny D115]